MAAEKKKNYHHGNLRDTLIQSALTLLEHGTIEDLTMRGLARAAGVSQTAPYRHFKDKDELIAQLKSDGFEQISEIIQGVKDRYEDPKERFYQSGVAYIEFARNNAAYFKLMFSHSFDDYERYPEMIQCREGAYEKFSQDVQECMKAAKGPVAQADHLAVEISSWSLVHGLSTLLLNQQFKHKLETEKEQMEMAHAVLRMHIEAFFGANSVSEAE